MIFDQTDCADFHRTVDWNLRSVSFAEYFWCCGRHWVSVCDGFVRSYPDLLDERLSWRFALLGIRDLTDGAQSVVLLSSIDLPDYGEYCFA